MDGKMRYNDPFKKELNYVNLCLKGHYKFIKPLQANNSMQGRSLSR